MRPVRFFHRPGLLVILVLFLLPVAQGQPFFTRIYTPNDGLPDAYTLGVYQDQSGYLWVGSYTGLSRFDGSSFEVIQAKSKSVSFSANVLLQDHLGRLWVNYGRSVCILQKDTILSFPTNDQRSISYVFGAVELSDHRLIALVDQGAYVFKETHWQKMEFPVPFAGLNCRQIIESPEGLYFNFEKYIALQTPDGHFQLLSPPGRDYFFINIQKAGRSVYALRVNGVSKLTDGRIEEIFSDQLSRTTCYNFLLDHQQRFWIATEDDGILVSDPGVETKLPHQVKLPFNLSTFLYESRDQTIWATNYEGLIKIREVGYEVMDPSSSSVFDDIRCIEADTEGQVYFQAKGHGLFVLDRVTGKPVRIAASEVPGFVEDVVDDMALDEAGALWMVTRGQKVLYYRQGRLRDMTSLFPGSAQFFKSVHYEPTVKQMLVTADRLYVGDEKGFMSWGNKFGTREIPGPRFVCVRKDGTLLVSTTSHGIFQVKGRSIITDISDQLDVEPGDREVRCYEDPRTGIWVTRMSEGIDRYAEPESGQFQRIATLTIQDGLPNNTLSSACFDAHQQLWVSTLSGPAVIHIDVAGKDTRYKIDRLGEELGRTVLNWGGSFSNMAYDGEHIWISTFHQLLRFDAGKTATVPDAPGVAIENIRLNFKETNWSAWADSLAGFFQLPVNPVLPYNVNSLAISCKAISFSDNPGLLYAYRLTGQNLDSLSLHRAWSEPTSNQEITYVRLPPGQYQFAVRAREAGGPWSDPLAFSFTIRNPFWRQAWFIGLVFLSIAGLIWWLVRLRIQQIQRKSEVQHQLNELELKALKSQMNPHFIYNALNSIQSLVMDGQQEEAVRYMSKFARLLRQVLEHSSSNFITLEKELSMLDIYVQLEKLRMHTSLTYEVALDDQILTEKELVPPLILQPFIENALWHGLSRKEGPKLLRLEIHADDDWLVITITDNGIGRQQAEKLKSGQMDYPRSMGMDITGKRLETTNMESASAIQFQDLADAEGNPAGTRVTVRIRRQA